MFLSDLKSYVNVFAVYLWVTDFSRVLNFTDQFRASSRLHWYIVHFSSNIAAQSFT